MGKFVILGIPSGVMFHLKARNGEVIGTSQIYASRNTAMSGIEGVILNCTDAAVEDQTIHNYKVQKNPKFEIFQEEGCYRFRLCAADGRLLLDSQKYTAKASCVNGIKSVRDNAPDAEVDG